MSFPSQPPPSFILGLDLGQAQDFSALSVIQKSPGPKEFNALGINHSTLIPFPFRYSVSPPSHFYDLRLVHRFPLHTSYTSVIDRLRTLFLNQLFERHSTLVVDATGVGAPFIELLRAAKLPVSLVPVVITAGQHSSYTSGTYHVPKCELVNNLTTALESSELRIAAKLPTRDILLREFHGFHTSVASSGHATYGAIAGEHDDLICSICLALWWARSARPIGPRADGPLL